MKSCPKHIFATLVVLLLLLLSGLLAYVVILHHSTPPGVHQSIEAMKNITKTTEEHLDEIVQNFTIKATETNNFISDYKKWFNVTKLFQDFVNTTQLCPFC